MTEKKEIEEIRDLILKENSTLTEYEAYDLAIKVRNLNYQHDIRHHLRKIEEVIGSSVNKNGEILKSICNSIDSLDNSINRLK